MSHVYRPPAPPPSLHAVMPTRSTISITSTFYCTGPLSCTAPSRASAPLTTNRLPHSKLLTAGTRKTGPVSTHTRQRAPSVPQDAPKCHTRSGFPPSDSIVLWRPAFSRPQRGDDCACGRWPSLAVSSHTWMWSTSRATSLRCAPAERQRHGWAHPRDEQQGGHAQGTREPRAGEEVTSLSSSIMMRNSTRRFAS
jgi:hypothetical protein